MTEIDREVVARRVRALLEKTTSNGCTEAEALAAAEKARALMDAYRLTQSDLEIAAEPIVSVLKAQLVTEAYAKLGLRAKRYSAGLQPGSSFDAGREAGNSVNLQRPVGGYGVRGRLA